MQANLRYGLFGLAAVGIIVVLVTGFYVWSIDRQYNRARDQADVVRSRLSNEDGSPALQELPQLTLDLEQLEDDLRELDRRVDRPLIGGLARNAPFVGGQVRSSEKLLDLGIELTEVSREASQIANEIKEAFEWNGFMGDEPLVGSTWLEVVSARQDDIYALERRYDAALQQRQALDVDALPGRAQNTLQSVDDILARGTQIRDEYFHLFPLLDVAFGAEEDARYLVLLQNGQELRQSGGFVGTYGMLTISNGRISELEINPIGILNQAYVDARSEVLTAPEPIREYLGQQEWFPHDANWSADFPMVADELTEMYADTGWPELQGIVAVNDSAVQAVLEIIGPYEVELEGDSESVTPENFLDLIQSFRGQGELHKEIVGDLGRSLIDQVIEADFETKKTIFWTMRDSADQREIQVAMLDPVMQAEVTRRGWDGALVPDADLPTLGLTISNITGNKASTHVAVNGYLALEPLDGAGEYLAELTIYLAHLGDPDANPDFHGFHRTWLQLYLPEGATFDEASRDPEPDEMTNESRATAWHIELYTGEQEVLTVQFTFSAPDGDLLLRRQSGLHNFGFAVQGESASGCDLDVEVPVTHDYLLDMDTCSLEIFNRNQIAAAE